MPRIISNQRMGYIEAVPGTWGEFKRLSAKLAEKAVPCKYGHMIYSVRVLLVDARRYGITAHWLREACNAS